MVTRRTVLISGAAATAAAFYAPSVLAAPKDTISFASAASGPATADPNLVTQGADSWHCAQLFEYLAQPADGDFGQKPEDFKPGLATKWTTSPDGKTWVFTLRQGVQFHKSYGEMTADDVAFTFKRAMTSGSAVSTYGNISSVAASGKYEVTMTLKNPDPLFLGSTIFTRNAMIVSKKAVSEKGDGFVKDVIGTGPYKMDRFDVEKGVYMSRHEGYWGEPAKIANVQCLYIADTTARTLALMSGEVDMIEGVRAPGWVPQIQAQRGDLHFDMTVPGSFNTLFFNLDKDPLQKLQVRQAIACGINRQEIVDAMKPLSRMSYTLDPPNYPTGYTHDALPADLRFDYDPDKAKALLKDAGFSSGLKIPVIGSQREDYRSQYLIIQQQLRKIGVTVDLQIIDHTAFHAQSNKNLNTLVINSSSLPPIPLYVFNIYAASAADTKDDGTGGGNYAHYGVKTPGVDKLLTEMLQTTTFDDYVKIGRQVELQIQKDLPLMALPTLSYLVVRNPRIDIGFDIKGGYAYWRFCKATITS